MYSKLKNSKTQKLILLEFLPVAVLAVSATSCTEADGLATAEQSIYAVAEGSFTVKAGIDDTEASRATVNQDGKGFTWQENDEFLLWQTTNLATSYEFHIDNSSITSDGKSANFVSDGFAPANEASYYAFYPAGFTVEGTKFTYTIPDEAYTQSGNNDTKHLGKAMVMIARDTSSDLHSGITFSHKAAQFRFGIVNNTESAVRVKSVELSSSDTECFARQYTYDIADGAEAVGNVGKRLKLNFSGDISEIGNGSSLKAYAMAIPAASIPAGGETFTLTVEYNDGTDRSQSISFIIDGSFSAGKYYTFNLNMNGQTGITSVNTGDFLHDNETVLVRPGNEIVVTGKGFGDVSSVKMGETDTETTFTSDTEIKFTVPQDFTEGKINISFSDGTSIDYDDIVFSLLGNNADVTPYALKNYKQPFKADEAFCSLAGIEQPTESNNYGNGNWYLPADWIVSESGRNMTTNDIKTGGLQNNTIILQAGWSSPYIANAKLYQTTVLPAGKYRLQVNLSECFDNGGRLCFLVAEGDTMPDLDDISANHLDIIALKDDEEFYGDNNAKKGWHELDFSLTETTEISLGFVVTWGSHNNNFRATEFKLIIIDDET